MRKLIFALLVISSLCIYREKFDKFHNRVLVSDDSIGYVDISNSGKSFLPYFYTPDHIYLSIDDHLYGKGKIVKLEDKSTVFILTTDIPKVSEKLPFNGRAVVTKEVPFYFLRLYEDNTKAYISIGNETRTVHFPTHLPITFIIETEDIYREFDYKLTLRGDDISLVKSVVLVTKRDNGDEHVLELKADKDKVFTSPVLNYYYEFCYLEINLIEQDKKIEYLSSLNFLQADLILIDDTKATQIDNKPQYLSVGQVFKKTTQIRSYDDFLIEFPQDLVTLTKTTLSKNAPIDLISVVVSEGRFHVTNRSLNPVKSYNSYEPYEELPYESAYKLPNIYGLPDVYEIEAEFVVKRMPKVSEPIVIARYNIENLKSTGGFIFRGSYYDDKVYFKASSKEILENNVYFSFRQIGSMAAESHQISIGYDALPSSEYVDFTEKPYKTQIVELKVDRKRAELSEIIIVGLKRSKDSYLQSTLSYFEVKITHDIYKTTLDSRGKVNFSLKKGQSIYIINYNLYFHKGHTYGDLQYHSQKILVETENGKVVSYATKIDDLSYEMRFSSLDGLFTFDDIDQFIMHRKFYYYYEEERRNYVEHMFSIIKITALTDETSGTMSHYE